MDNRIENLANLISSFKKGSKIHIKKENRGKFTDYCGGKVTSECIARGKSSPNPAIRKRATFAANARKWKHAEGGEIGSNPTFEGIKTTNNRPYNPVYISYINDKLREAGMNKNKRTAILANIIEESGGNPFAKGPGGFYGLLQWSNGRYTPTNESNVYAELDNQINYILQTEGNANDRKSWTHGGKGSGYNSLKDAMNAFNSDILDDVVRGFTLGYVRPAGALDSLNNRTAVANQINNLSGYYKKGGNISNKNYDLVYQYLSPSEEEKFDLPDIEQIIYGNYKPDFQVIPVNVPFVKETESSEYNSTSNSGTQQVVPVVTAEESEPEKELENDAVETIDVDSPKSIVPGNIVYKHENMDVGNMQELIDLMREEGISFRITSGKREGAKTSNGSVSHHSAGNAIDITPIKGQSWDDLMAQMKRSSRFLEYMRSHGLGILDERSKEMQAKTGATGAHFHIGPDRSARRNFITLFG